MTEPAKDCLTYDAINSLCLDTGWPCDGIGKCDLYFSVESLGIPPEILEDTDELPEVQL